MNHKRSVLSLSSLLLFSAVHSASAQTEPPPWQWASQYGGDLASVVPAQIAVDNSGNSYVTGSFFGTAQFGSFTLTNSGWGADVFLVKINPQGETLWARSAGGFDSDVGRSVTVDADGNAYIAGSYFGDAEFGSILLPGDFSEDIFLAKYNAAGDLQWVRSAGGFGNDEAFAVAVDNDGNPYITGYFTDFANFGSLPTLASAGGHDIFLAAYSASGNEKWAIRAGGSGFGYQGEGGHALTVDASGDLYVAGNFVGTAHFGNLSVTSAGSLDAFVAKYSPATATWQWVSKGGGTGEDFTSSLELDSAGNVIVAGVFSDTASFGGETLVATSNSSWLARNYFVAKYDLSGALQWANSSPGVGYYAGHGLALDENDNIYLAATFDGVAVIGDVTLTSSGYDNAYIRKLNTNGESEWLVQSFGDDYNVSGGLAINTSGEILLAGWFSGTAEFGEIVLSQSTRALSVAKMGGFPVVEVPILAARLDIRPGSCENPLQAKSKGVLPLAILGMADFDVASIDLSTVTLWRADGIGGAVSPLQSPGPAFEDVGECQQVAADGLLDLTLKFSVEQLVQVLELGNLPRGTEVELVISGAYAGDSEFAGIDAVRMR